ncbi:hypothetical protein MD484_g6226, partial [Candolleomyces efflorescens]
MPNKKSKKNRPAPEVSDEDSDPHTNRRRARKGKKNAQLAQEPIATSQKLATAPISANKGVSMFEGAHHFRTESLNITMVNPPPLSEGFDGQDFGWKLLVTKISPNALHNSSARYDPPKCDEGTRVGLLKELMTRITNRRNPRRLLCMTGPAGSGKSALQQTIAERCEELDILGSAYFFATADTTRNTVSAIVPTIAYQLGSHNPVLKQAIDAVVAKDTVIFDKSLRVQMDTLIVRPLRHLQESESLDIATLPYVILIDGLDECKGEERQTELLTVIRDCLLADNLPFYVLIASRPEWAIRSALEQGGHLRSVAIHIDLSDYYAGADMRHYLRTRFEVLTSRTGNPTWFTEDDIQTLVNAGSGQFVYVSTVYAWISERRGSPAQRLRIVLSWASQPGETARPFDALDRLYINILLNAKIAYESVDMHSGRDFLLIFNIHHTNTSEGLLKDVYSNHQLSRSAVTQCLDLESDSLEILISDLHSLVSIRTPDAFSPNSYLHIHHKSFSDFLNSETRAKDFFVSRSRIYEHLIKCSLHRILRSSDSYIVSDTIFYLAPLWTSATVPLNLDDEIIDFTQRGGWQKMDSSAGFFSSNSESHKLLKVLEGIQERKPEVFQEMKMYFEKWECEFDKTLAAYER